MPEDAETPEQAEAAPLSEEGTERLSIFEDFLEKLEFDKPDDKPDDDDETSGSGPSDKPKKPKKK